MKEMIKIKELRANEREKFQEAEKLMDTFRRVGPEFSVTKIKEVYKIKEAMEEEGLIN